MVVDFEERDGIVFVKLNRPEVFNAINEEFVEELKRAVDYARKSRTARVMIITGEGKAFCAGADIRMFSEYDPYNARRFVENLGTVLEELEDLDIPVIAAVNGFALGGGCELAMACDIIIASEKASFGQPEINIGVIPGAGGTQRFARLVGWKRAMELCLTGERIDADEACKLGLVNRVVEHERLMEEAVRIAEKIREKPPHAVMLVKHAVNRGFRMNLKDGIMYERDLLALSFASEDVREGMNAFIEKRKAEFKKKKEWVR